jgi:hypothetical protein
MLICNAVIPTIPVADVAGGVDALASHEKTAGSSACCGCGCPRYCSGAVVEAGARSWRPKRGGLWCAIASEQLKMLGRNIYGLG